MEGLSKAEFEAGSALRVEPVPAPEYGEGKCVFVRVMSGQGRYDFSEGRYTEKKKDNPVAFDAALTAYTVCDEQGNLLFSQADIPALAKNQSGVLLARISETAAKLNMLGEQNLAGAVKNSASGQNSSSGSDSPAI